MTNRTSILALVSALTAAAPLAARADDADRALAASFVPTDAIDARAAVKHSAADVKLARESYPGLAGATVPTQGAAPRAKTATMPAIANVYRGA
jgi:hypothetical protein